MIGVGDGSRSTARTMTDAIKTVEGVAVSRCFAGGAVRERASRTPLHCEAETVNILRIATDETDPTAAKAPISGFQVNAETAASVAAHVNTILKGKSDG
jgi:hypothetical protein